MPSVLNQPPLGLPLNSAMEKALAITGIWPGSICLKLYEELGWETLSDRPWTSIDVHGSSYV